MTAYQIHIQHSGGVDTIAVELEHEDFREAVTRAISHCDPHERVVVIGVRHSIKTIGEKHETDTPSGRSRPLSAVSFDPGRE